MIHHTTGEFWDCYARLPRYVQELADKNFDLLKHDPQHPSLHFKKIGELYSVRIGLHYRALGLDEKGDIYWFWIGSHPEYERLLKGLIK